MCIVAVCKEEDEKGVMEDVLENHDIKQDEYLLAVESFSLTVDRDRKKREESSSDENMVKK